MSSIHSSTSCWAKSKACRGSIGPVDRARVCDLQKVDEHPLSPPLRAQQKGIEACGRIIEAVVDGITAPKVMIVDMLTSRRVFCAPFLSQRLWPLQQSTRLGHAPFQGCDLILSGSMSGVSACGRSRRAFSQAHLIARIGTLLGSSWMSPIRLCGSSWVSSCHRPCLE